MANLLTKIEKLGLADEVNRLILDGASGNRIYTVLVAAGHRVSESGVQRYMAKVRDVVRDSATAIFDQHVEEHLPADLEHLEQIQLQAKKWHETAPADRAAILAAAEMEVSGRIGQWMAWVQQAVDLDARQAVVRLIVKEAVEIVAKDYRGQRARIEAMAIAIKTIETKLRNIGALQNERKGQIVIVDRSGDYAPPDPERAGAPTSHPLKLSLVRPNGRSGV